MKKQFQFLLIISFFVIAIASAEAADKALSGEDKKFLNEAASGGMMEVQLGKMAQQKTQSQDVKDFGTRMVNDHASAGDELKKVAQKEMKLPGKLESKHQKTVSRLSKVSGADFDRQYMQEMVKDHAQDVADFQNASNKVVDPDLNGWVRKTLPVLEQHLSQAKEVAGKMGIDINKAEQEGRAEAEKKEKRK